MKKSILLTVFLSAIIFVISSCNKTCDDSTAPNYNQTGTCTDLTSGVIGTYTGTFIDSTAGASSSTSTTGQSVAVTKVDDSHIKFTPSNNQFYPFYALLTTGSNGTLLLTINPGSYQGQTFTGISFSGYNGTYAAGTMQLTSGITTGSDWEIFLGTHQ